MSMFFAPTSARLNSKITWKDIVLGLATPLATFWIRDPKFFSEELFDVALTYTLISCAWWLLVAVVLKTNLTLNRYFAPADAKLILIASAVVVAGTALTSFVLWRLDSIPRSLPLLHFVIMSTTHILIRARSHQRHARRERRYNSVREKPIERNVIILGCNRLAWFYIRILDTFSLGKQKVVALVDENPSHWGRALGGRIVAGPSNQLSALIDEYSVHGVRIHMLVVALLDESKYQEVRTQIEGVCERFEIPIVRLSHVLGLVNPSEGDEDGEINAIPQDAASISKLPFYWRVKRALDFFFAVILIVIFLPVFFVVGVFVWFDVGSPIFFWQQRIGQNGDPLYVYKFRTLRAPIDSNGKKISDEQRLSALGNFIRRTRFDELPQLWNILNGEMSFIGPRPLMEIDHPEDDKLRCTVPPGITGWAQVVGGRLTTSEEKSALDEWYIQNASPLLDLKLVYLTIAFLIFGESRDEAAIGSAIEERNKRRMVR